MKISFNWLNDYIDIEEYRAKMDQLSALLTQAGLEVEGIENPAEHWDNIVVGKLISVDKHPDADKLTLCKVDVGDKEPQQIVCGAKNHKQGDHVVAALPGAVLPGNFKIKKSKIRGVESLGMLCSEKELGLSEEADGILILGEEAHPGMAFADHYKDADVVFDLNVTPNRADCLSHMGLARELSTLLDRPVKTPEVNLKEKGFEISKLIKVELKAPKECPRYCGRMMRGVKVGPSPAWLKTKLEAVGVNSINNIVDVTNFVLFEYGQPLHAFDYENIKKQMITIEMAKSGDSFTTLDGTEVKLSDTDLLIKDGERGVALAGVVGGLNSGVSEKTADIFIESAFFASEGVRKTSRSHGIETDSCYRFSRGVDPEQTLNALDRACQLMQDVAGGEILKGQVDLYPEPVEANKISVTTEYVSERCGYEVTAKDFENWMKRLNCKVEKTGMGYDITPPSYRWDLHIPEDIVEEYARLHGYEHIEETLPQLVDEPTKHVFGFEFENNVKNILTGLGCYQAINYAFIAKDQSLKLWGDPKKAQACGLVVTDKPVVVANPISEDLKYMRESLLPGLLGNIVHNDHHGVSWGQLFEMGPCHFTGEKGFDEEMRLALAFWGEPEGLWSSKQDNYVVYALKSAVEGMLTKLGGKSYRWQKIKAEDCPPAFHPGQTAQLFYEGKIIGCIGTLHPSIKAKNKIRREVAWGEFNFDALSTRQPRFPKFSVVPKFPAVERDIALVAPEGLASDEIGAQIKKAAGPLLENFEVFDIYQDKEMKAAGRRSIAYRLRFQSEKETLSDDQINALRDQVVNSVCQKLPVEIR